MRFCAFIWAVCGKEECPLTWDYVFKNLNDNVICTKLLQLDEFSVLCRSMGAAFWIYNEAIHNSKVSWLSHALPIPPTALIMNDTQPQ